jgi:hypothetical protein
MGSRSIIAIAISTQVEVNLIIHILFTIIHLLITLAILLRMLIYLFTIGLSYGGWCAFDFWFCSGDLWCLLLGVPKSRSARNSLN